MPKLTKQCPSYRLHRKSGQAVVTLKGRDFYLGPYGTKASRLEYDRLIVEWLANGRSLPMGTPHHGVMSLTISELLLAYLQFTKGYYVKHGRPTSEQANIRQAIRPLNRLYEATPVAEFGPLALKAVRQQMIDAGHCRKYINGNISRIKQMFRCGVENELASPSVYHGLQAVRGLAKGRSEARETEPIKPVPDEHVDVIEPFVSAQVWAIIQLQRITGMRPGETRTMRGCDLDMSGNLWEYRPESHKTEHHGRERIISLGPRAQKVVCSFLKADLSAPLFSPADAEAERLEKRHARRKTPLSYGNRPGINRQARPKRKPLDHYTVDSYRRAIARGCDLVFPPPGPLAQRAKETAAEWRERLTARQTAELKAWQKAHRWHPNQLRHSAGTKIRKEMGLEAAQVYLGHSKADVTQIYAERNLDLARQIAAKFG